jgi:hypothetical protein
LSGGQIEAGSAVAQTHRDLNAWREAMSVVKLVYEVTAKFPNAEM